MANSLRGEVLNLYKNKKYIFGKVTTTNSSGKRDKNL
uniref:Electron transfer flavoprotein regulatory factor 1 n=1 Tax=Microcebus murinus TaxID=30608 RepID=A0A8C5XGZ5_MICMU